jgi:hypothetical protein
MEYEPDFARSFMQRTLTLATEYQGPLDATLLVNCLLGLLVVPKESLLEKIPKVAFSEIRDRGISPSSVKRFGKCNPGQEHEPDLRQLVQRLRNAVAHFRLEPIHLDGEVRGYSFSDQNGFHAELELAEIKAFVLKLAAHLRDKA